MKLFHCIVVMGAAIGAGCGGEAAPIASGSRDGSSGDPANDGSVGQGADDAGKPGADSGCFPDSGSTVNAFTSGPSAGCAYADPCTGTREDPLSPRECAHPQQLECANVAPYRIVSTPHGCTCDPTAPLVPTDCPQTAQFNCADWTGPCGCWCDSNAPTSESSCTQGPGDAAVPWICHSYDPPVGCVCHTVPPPIL